MKKKKLLPVIAVVVLGVAVWFGLFRKDGTSGRLMISGNIEATEVRLGFRISGSLVERPVDEGDTVSQGQVLGRLDSRDQDAAVGQARAGLDQARAALAELEAGSRPEEIRLSLARVNQAKQQLAELTSGSRPQEIDSARAELASALEARQAAVVQLELAKADVRRYDLLFKEKTVSQRDYEVIEAGYKTALHTANEAEARVSAARQALSLKTEGPRKEQIQQAVAALDEAEASYDLVRQGPRQETIDQARAAVRAAEETLNQALLQQQYAELSAPLDGVVLSTSAEPGEYLNPGSPVLVLGDVRHPWVRAFVNETDLGQVTIGQEVGVFTDAFPDRRFPGTITFISSQAEFTPKSVQTHEERVKLVYRIKVSLENPDLDLKPGMPADVVVGQEGA